MRELPDDIEEFVAGVKFLGATPIWDEKSDPLYIVFTHPITAEGVTTAGFQLRVKVSRRWVHRDAMMQLEYAPAGKRSAVGVWRLDWRPFHTHGNKALPPDVAWESYDGSHHHPFADNYMPAAKRMRPPNLPCGRPFPREPNGLSDFLAFGAELFRIKDIRRVILPVSGPDLLWVEDD